jgi:hypothetical protein
MKLSAGQAGKICMEAAHQIGRIAMLLFMLALAALGLFAFTLSRQPIELPHLASWLATMASGSGITVRVQDAQLAWEGYHQGGSSPLVLRVSDIEVRSAAGVLLVEIPHGDLVLPPSVIFGGRQAVLMRASKARISGSAAPVTVHAEIWPGPGFTLARGTFYVTIGSGLLGKEGARVPVSSARFTMRTAPGMVDIDDGVALLKPIGGSAPATHFTFTARRDHGWTAQLHVTADAVRAQELAQYWPAPALQITREWVVTHITAGVARNADFTFSLAAPDNLARLSLTDATGGFVGSGLTLYWLKDFLPITGLNGRFTMPDKDVIVITATAGQVQKVMITQGQMNITGVSHKDQTGVLTMSLNGQLQDVFSVLNTPPLRLLHNAPAMLNSASGQTNGQFTATIPFKKDLVFDDVRLAVTADVRNLTMPNVLPPLGATQGTLQVQTDGHRLQITGTALFAGEPATVTVQDTLAGTGKMDLTLTSAAGPQIWRTLHLDRATPLNTAATGTAPFTLRVTGTGTAGQTAVLRANLGPAAVALPVFGWAKKAGAAGSLGLTAQLRNGAFVAVTNFAAQAPDLDVQGIQEGNGLTFTDVTIGRNKATGRIVWPSAPGSGWIADFSGAVLDLRQVWSGKAKKNNPAEGEAGEASSAIKPMVADTSAAPPSGPGWTVRLSFDRLYLAQSPAPALGALTVDAKGRGATLLAAQAAADGLDLSIRPEADGQSAVSMHSDDTGTLLRALGQYQHLQGGTLVLGAHFGPQHPLAGAATLMDARFVDAPDVTKVLEALTLYGVANAASGPGLLVSHSVIPFTLREGVLGLHDARASTSSLGFTASGTVNLTTNFANIEATVVPLYALNSLPGRIPLIGRLFAPERGGGLFAMRAHIIGPIDHIEVHVNPLSAVTPGFLRSLFGLGGALRRPPPAAAAPSP